MVSATWTMIGIITATTGVLFMKAEASTTKAKRPAIVRRGLRAALRSASWLMLSSAPVRTSPPMMRNMKAMVQGAGLASTSDTCP